MAAHDAAWDGGPDTVMHARGFPCSPPPRLRASDSEPMSTDMGGTPHAMRHVDVCAVCSGPTRRHGGLDHAFMAIDQCAICGHTAHSHTTLGLDFLPRASPETNYGGSGDDPMEMQAWPTAGAGPAAPVARPLELARYTHRFLPSPMDLTCIFCGQPATAATHATLDAPPSGAAPVYAMHCDSKRSLL